MKSLSKNMRDANSGSLSLLVLALFFFLSALLLLGYSYLKISLSQMGNQDGLSQEYLSGYREAALREMNKLRKTHGSSPVNIIYDQTPTKSTSLLSVRVNELSSRINPNLVQRSLFEKTTLDQLFQNGRNATQLQAFRKESGMSPNIKTHYQEFFVEESFKNILTGYSYVNINNCDELSLEDIIIERTGDAILAEYVRNRVRTERGAQRVIDSSKLESILGSSYDQLYPLINTEASWNINVVDEKLLRAIVNYDAFSIEEPEKKISTLLKRRSQGAVEASALLEIFELPVNHRLFSYLGSDSWFWEIAVEGSEGTLSWIVYQDLRDRSNGSSLSLLKENWIGHEEK